MHTDPSKIIFPDELFIAETDFPNENGFPGIIQPKAHKIFTFLNRCKVKSSIATIPLALGYILY